MGTGFTVLMSERDEAYARYDAVHNEINRLYEKMKGLDYGDFEVDEVRRRIDDLRKEADDCWKEYEYFRDEYRADREYEWYGFTRPTGRFVNTLNRWLGPLPKRAVVIQPNKEALREVKSRWPLALVTVLVAITALVLMTVFVPVLASSPYTLTHAAVLKLTGSHTIASLVSGVAFIVILWFVRFNLKRGPREGGFLANAAMLEELWFRMGCESWSWRQRFTGCLAFGLVHVLNFIYPIASLLVVGLVVGGAITMVYLREYARSNDTGRATLAAAKFHLTYNYFAIVYFVVALVCVAVISVV